MLPAPGEVLHFSEDPTITEFVPHVAATARQADAYVWAVDADQAPDYWFPRDCPRVTVRRDGSDEATAVLGAGDTGRVHAVEHRWLDRIRTAELYAYRLPSGPFAPFGEPVPHARVATVAVRPLGPAEPVGDLLAAHARAGIELRVLADLRSVWTAVAASSLTFSGIRLRNAVPPIE